MTDDIGQRALRETAHQLVDALSTFESVLLHADVHYFQHSQFAARSRSLGACLDSALRLADDQAYPQSFAMLRIALEHHVFDRLLFLAVRREQIIDKVDVETWRRWEPSKPPGAISWKRTKNGRVRIVWPGVRVHDPEGSDTGQTLSIYYKWWIEYDPFAAGDRDRMAPGHPVDPDGLRRHAAAQRDIWQNALAWRNLKANLELNELTDSLTIEQLGVHYQFLSAFVHPVSEQASQLPYPRNVTEPVFDHYSEELILLYACFITIEELRAFYAMTQRPPQVVLRDWSTRNTLINRGERLIAHGWLPGRPPFEYDRVIELNQRAFDLIDTRLTGQFNLQNPETLQDNEVRYYANPFRRLVSTHKNFTELSTRQSWASPWFRPDAQYR